MTIADLIEHLQLLPPETLVFTENDDELKEIVIEHYRMDEPAFIVIR